MHDVYPLIRDALASEFRSSRLVGLASFDFGTMAEVLLSQTTAKTRASEIWNALVNAGLEAVEDLASADLSELTEATRGRKSSAKPISAEGMQPLQRLARWVVDCGGMDALEGLDSETIRDQLGQIAGVGPATVDALLLKIWNRPTYPVDRASYRILARHGWIEPTADYEEVRETIAGLEPDNPPALAQLAEDFAEIGRRYCRATKALCEECPLRPFLPESGPYGEDG